jgi:circadian clock protein KaiB
MPYQSPVTSSFKGIALFTPGGDCVYCLDSQKRSRWHMDLCAALQSQLDLVEPPYFLLPGFTATVDRWYDEARQQSVTIAEAYPRALKFQALLNILFGLGHQQWTPNYTLHEACSASLIESFRNQFPQLWESHNLILQVEEPLRGHSSNQRAEPSLSYSSPSLVSNPYIFKLFVSGAETVATEHMLKLLHATLERGLQTPYTLQVIDVLKHPEQAEADHISATPSLIQVSPQPVRRIVGNLTNPDLLSQVLTTTTMGAS